MHVIWIVIACAITSRTYDFEQRLLASNVEPTKLGVSKRSSFKMWTNIDIEREKEDIERFVQFQLI